MAKSKEAVYNIKGEKYMIRKKWFLLFVMISICGCSSPSQESSSTSSFLSDLESSSILSTPGSSYTSIGPSSSTSNEIVSSNLPSSFISSSASVVEEYNPDGSLHLPSPTNETKLEWSQTESKYDFTNSFPEGFRYIYGHKILDNPNFYADGGWKITVPNSQARIGLQTPHFQSDLKIEIRLYLSGVFNSNNKVDEDNPWIRIYGFDENGKLTQVKEVLSPVNFYQYANSSNPINFYMSGENVSYLELRFAASPYKGSQCYNFGIKEIGFKTFPYAYED